MRKKLLPLVFLMLTVFCTNSFARPILSKQYLTKVATMPAAAKGSKDDATTEFMIYFLIAGVYGLYWLKQRA